MNVSYRFIDLFVALVYDTETLRDYGKSFLTSGQRICINQERAFLMREFEDGKEFEQSPIVNQKIDFILQKVQESSHENLYVSHVKSLINF